MEEYQRVTGIIVASLMICIGCSCLAICTCCGYFCLNGVPKRYHATLEAFVEELQRKEYLPRLNDETPGSDETEKSELPELEERPESGLVLRRRADVEAERESVVTTSSPSTAPALRKAAVTEHRRDLLTSHEKERKRGDESRWEEDCASQITEDLAQDQLLAGRPRPAVLLGNVKARQELRDCLHAQIEVKKKQREEQRKERLEFEVSWLEHETLVMAQQSSRQKAAKKEEKESLRQAWSQDCKLKAVHRRIEALEQGKVPQDRPDPAISLSLRPSRIKKAENSWSLVLSSAGLAKKEMLPFTSPPVVMKSVSFNMSTQSTLEEAPEEEKAPSPSHGILKKKGTSRVAPEIEINDNLILRSASVSDEIGSCRVFVRYVINPDNSVIATLWQIITTFALLFVALVTPIQVGLMDVQLNWLFVVLGAGLSWACVLGEVCAIVAEMNAESQEFRRKMHNLNKMMSDQGLPSELRLRLRGFFLQNRHQTVFTTHQRLLMNMRPPSADRSGADRTRRIWRRRRRRRRRRPGVWVI
eukprot:g22536.t1